MKVFIMLPFHNPVYDDERRQSVAQLTKDYAKQFKEQAFLYYNISEVLVKYSRHMRNNERRVYSMISPKTLNRRQ